MHNNYDENTGLFLKERASVMVSHGAGLKIALSLLVLSEHIVYK